MEEWVYSPWLGLDLGLGIWVSGSGSRAVDPAVTG